MSGTNSPVGSGRDLLGLASEAGRAAVERLPALYLAGARHRADNRLLVNDDVDVVIDGFPRSGNTYLLAWVGLANPKLRIASHVHSVAHVALAVRRGVPVVVAARPPEDAVTSEMILVDGAVSIRRLLWRYGRFYRRLQAYLDDIVVSPFELTTSQPAAVVSALCERFNLQLVTAPPGGEEGVMRRVNERTVEVAGRVDEMAVSRPSADRDAVAAQVREELRSRYGSVLADLTGLHDHVVSSASAVRCS